MKNCKLLILLLLTLGLGCGWAQERVLLPGEDGRKEALNGVNFMVPALQVQNIFCNIATNLGEGTQTCRINLETQYYEKQIFTFSNGSADDNNGELSAGVATIAHNRRCGA